MHWYNLAFAWPTECILLDLIQLNKTTLVVPLGVVPSHLTSLSYGNGRTL